MRRFFNSFIQIKRKPKLVLSFDGGGEEESTVICTSQKDSYKIIKRINWPNSLGHFYSFFTGFLGFKMLEDEYKMMVEKYE